MKTAVLILVLCNSAFADSKLFYVGATWCVPCQRMHKEVFDKTGEDSLVGNGFKIVHYPKVDGHIVLCDIDEDFPSFLEKPSRIPTFFYVKDKRVMFKEIGVFSAQHISEKYRELQTSTE